VGEKKEEPSIIDDLLNIEKYPCKPQYTMSSESPLILFDCQYENIQWIYDHHELEKVIKHFQDIWLNNQTKAIMIRRIIDNLEENMKKNESNESDKKSNDANASMKTNQRTLKQPYKSLQGKSQSLNYVKFEKRQKAHSLESRVDHYVKKRRLDSEIYEKINDANNLAQSLNLYNNNKQNN
jgi:tRNA pseudouridine38/39 synthase